MNTGHRADGPVTRGARVAAGGLDLVGGGALVAMLVHVNLDVLGRYLFNAPLPMTIEVVSYYYMVAVVFLPMAAVEWRDGHISVEILAQLLGTRANAVLLGVTGAVAAGYFALLAWRTLLVALDKFQLGEFVTGVMALATWPTRFMVPAGCGLIALVILIKLAALIRAR